MDTDHCKSGIEKGSGQELILSAGRYASRITLIYLLIGGVWILCSDWIVRALSWNPGLAYWMGTLKGLAFVAVTGALLYGLCHRRFAALIESRRQLAESQRMFATLLGNLPGIAYRRGAGAGGRFQIVSDGCRVLLGIEPQALISGCVGIEQFIVPEDLAVLGRELAAAEERGGRYEVSYRLLDVRGGPRWVVDRGRVIYDGEGRVEAMEGFIADVTEQRRAEQLERERNGYEQSVRAMRRALGVVGHELRTPLAGLRAMAEYLLMDEPSASDQANGFLQGIHDEVIRMSEMVNNMLEAARLDSGRAAWHWSSVDVQRVCGEAMEIIRPLVDATKVRLELRVAEDATAMNGDADGIRRLVLNLLSNASRHTREGRIGVEVGCVREGAEKWIEIRVTDTGPGIDPETLRVLGVAFASNRGAVGTAGTASGAGLGLAICKQIAAAHGGRLSVQSQRRQGTVFVARLRADLPGASSQASQAISVAGEMALV